jgi:NTP pyrophosphatase (non-canonical NTP hydrolase)
MIRVIHINQVDIFNAIIKERKRQDYLHPKNKKEEYLAIMIEEVGEIARAIQLRDKENLKDEITQVAAVAVRWLEAL